MRQTNQLSADLIVLLGDYWRDCATTAPARCHSDEWSKALAGLKAPLGVHAILGNHDWWEDRPHRKRPRPDIARLALERVGIPVYENDVVRLTKVGAEHSGWPDWGISSRSSRLAAAFPIAGRRRRSRRTLRKVPDGEPVILLAHEPDIMPRVPDRVSLVMSGHTHGGQVRLFGWSPVVPSRYGNRYAYGHVREQCDLIVSGGLGCSIFPVRFGMPPEIVMVSITGARAGKPRCRCVATNDCRRLPGRREAHE